MFYSNFNTNCPMKTIESKCALQTYQGAYKACSEISTYCPLWYVLVTLSNNALAAYKAMSEVLKEGGLVE